MMTRHDLSDARRDFWNRRVTEASGKSLDDRIHCDTGWRTIINSFLDRAERPGLVLISARENWGILQLVYSPGDDAEIAAHCRMAVEQSTRTCERCGQPGLLRQQAWRKTLCDLHAATNKQTISGQ